MIRVPDMTLMVLGKAASIKKEQTSKHVDEVS